MNLSKMSDAELKEYYKNREEEKARRYRIQEEIRQEKIQEYRAKKEEEIREYEREHPVKKRTEGEEARSIVGALLFLIIIPLVLFTAPMYKMPEELGVYIFGIMILGGGIFIIPFIPRCFKE